MGGSDATVLVIWETILEMMTRNGSLAWVLEWSAPTVMTRLTPESKRQRPPPPRMVCDEPLAPGWSRNRAPLAETTTSPP